MAGNFLDGPAIDMDGDNPMRPEVDPLAQEAFRPGSDDDLRASIEAGGGDPDAPLETSLRMAWERYQYRQGSD